MRSFDSTRDAALDPHQQEHESLDIKVYLQLEVRGMQTVPDSVISISSPDGKRGFVTELVLDHWVIFESRG